MVSLLQVLPTPNFPFRHLTSLDYVPHSTCGHWWIGQLHEIARPSYTRVPAEMVYLRYFIWFFQGGCAYRLCELITLFHRFLWYLSQPISKVTVRCHQGHIYAQFIFRSQFLDGVQPSSYEHLAGCFSLHSGFAWQSVWHPVVHA